MIWYMVPEIYRPDGQSFLSFWAIFCPLSLLTTRKIKIWEKWKKAWRYYVTLLYHKWRSYDVWFLRYGARQTNFLSFWFIFCPFNLKNQNFEKMKKIPRYHFTQMYHKFGKNEKKAWQYYHITLLYHKWWSYDVWLMRYEVRQS